MELKMSEKNEFGDGVTWYRGAMVGKGSFGCVFLATLKNPRLNYSYFPAVMAVKSAEVSNSGSIQKEKEVLDNVKGCKYIIRCYGDETTTGENGAMVYNLLLEYGSGGTLAERIKIKSDLSEFEVRNHTRSMLRGLHYIHSIGYVHCDMKPDNVLLVPNSSDKGSEFKVKIGDLGLAKRENLSKKRRLEPYWRGTPMYLSPEAVSDNVQECPADIWALGCIVLEMLTGKPPWDRDDDMDAGDVLRMIGGGHELPNIPDNLSKESKEFLKGCFVRNPRYRWTAEMLLTHPFVDGLVDDDGVEPPMEVEDINEVDSIILVTESDDELAYFSEDWSCVSEDDSLDYLSEEDYEEIENEMSDSGSDHVLDPSVKVSSGSPSNNLPKCPLNFTIPAGV